MTKKGWFLGAILLLAVTLPTLAASPVEPPSPEVVAEAKAIVEAMKKNPRGPCSQLRWYCKDGTVHPPRPYACADRGGGMQHCEYSQERERLASLGFHVGTVFAAMTPEELLDAGGRHARVRELPLESYLVDVDDGWVLRQARSYRGRTQIEDEESVGRTLLLALLDDDALVSDDWLLVREAVRTIPHAGGGADRTREMRRLSGDLSSRDKSFEPLRVKIHNGPGPEDIASVQAWIAKATERGVDEGLLATAKTLVDEMDALYGRKGRLDRMDAARQRLAKVEATSPAAALLDGVDAATPRDRVRRLAGVMRALREAQPKVSDAAQLLGMLDLSVDVEAEVSRSAFEALEQKDLPRRDLFALAADLADAAYGSGLLSERERAELGRRVVALGAGEDSGADHLAVARAFERSSTWAVGAVRHAFAEPLARYEAIEPKAARFPDDLLRGSPMLPLADAASRLAREAERQQGVLHRVFGQELSGLAGLNPGAAIGTLKFVGEGEEASVTSDDIVVLARTTSELRPVAGILTVSEGNALSHVQMLARNLGIPNAVVPSTAVDALRRHAGSRVLLAVGTGGAVALLPLSDVPADVRERIEGSKDVAKVDAPMPDLSVDYPLTLEALDASLSGKVVGPKAANVGQLAKLFPGRVAPAIALPFGLYADHAAGPGSPKARLDTAFAKRRAGELDDAGLAAEVEAVRVAVEALKLRPDLHETLRGMFAERFGAEGTYGVFVRSDTNVEDLPQFTGAGLNKTIANVVGTDAILAAVPKVWASPFAPRAMAWRTRALTRPEDVYPSVLLMKSVPSEKSGVLATADVVTGGEGATITMAWGVGGAVDGEISETLVLRPDGTNEIVSEAKAPYRRRLLASGGVDWTPAPSGRVLEDAEIAQVRQLVLDLAARTTPEQYADGRAMPWDVELGFVGGELVLFQLRPLAAKGAARADSVLRSLAITKVGAAGRQAIAPDAAQATR